MIQRGRKSAAEIETTALVPTVQAQRLLAPAILTDAEQMVWADVVNDQPADSITQVHAPLLMNYCRHVVSASIISEEINAFDLEWIHYKDGLRRYAMLLAMRDREVRAASSLATRLRLTRQSMDPTVLARGRRAQPTTKKPWELTFDDAG